jgi:TPR repeat protein
MTEMKLFLRFIHKSFLLILVVLAGCPTTPDALLNQGIKHLNKGQYDKANPDRNKAMEKHYLEAISSREKGQMAKACIGYQQACELGSDAACDELDMLEEEGLCRRLINVMK